MPSQVATPGVYVQDQTELHTGSFPQQFQETTEESQSNPLQTETIINLTETLPSQEAFDPQKTISN